ncbi:hypothetical protein BU17DRAFT_83947 [Hysterangium stoloniferum]|nr:hypothetical protein BU17DRAFT_83947 [Hysterangium stoloniferum]
MAPSKIRRVRLYFNKPVSGKGNGVDDFAKLPLEMLAEILSYTSSPDILSLARTSRFFLDVLVINPWSLIIWKKARERFQPSPIPDPLPNWTETSYIAFLFDRVPCEMCGKMTKLPPYSYALRARLCDKHGCHVRWVSQLIGALETGHGLSVIDYSRAIQTWMPYHDHCELYSFSRRMLRTYLTAAFSSHTPPDDWEVALRRHKDAILDLDRFQRLDQEYAKKARQLPIIMEFHKKIESWSTKVRVWQVEINLENKKLLKSKALANGWDLQDVQQTQLYEALMKTHDDMGERLTEEAYFRVQYEFREQVAQCRKNRIRALIDNTTRLNRKDLQRYWNSLKTSKKGPLPAYAQFRRLNMARILELKNTDEKALLKKEKESVRHELRHNAHTRDHLTREINAWLNDQRAKLSDKMGHSYAELVVAGGYQHPVERINAWFICTRCKKETDPMDFERVCGHRCRGLTDVEKAQGAWDVAWFEVDTKAIAAGNELLRISALDEKFTETKKSLIDLGARFLCKACPSPIVMDGLSIIRHAKRHDTMTLEFLTSEDAARILGKPLQPGLAARFMAYSKCESEARQRADFICRHCQNVKKRFNFDGLRSHLKTKHGVTDVRDEDLRRETSNGDISGSPTTEIILAYGLLF